MADFNDFTLTNSGSFRETIQGEKKVSKQKQYFVSYAIFDMH